MRIRAVVPLYPPHSLVGAWITTHEFLAHMVRRGHHVEVVAYASMGAATMHDGVRVVTSFAHTSSDPPDVIIGHAGDDGSAADVAARTSTPLVLMVHGGTPTSVQAACRPATLVVFNAHSYARQVDHDGPQVVCHPYVDPDRYRTTPGEQITLINMCAAKGGPLFWRLAEARPHDRFLAVRGGWGEQIIWSGHPNVTIQRLTPRMVDQVYARTRILLMPSETETYGRVALEAACSGIPTIAHPTAGVIEAMGEHALYANRDDLDAWCELLDDLTSPDRYLDASVRASQRAAALTPQGSLDDFADALEAVAAREVPA